MKIIPRVITSRPRRMNFRRRSFSLGKVQSEIADVITGNGLKALSVKVYIFIYVFVMFYACDAYKEHMAV